MVSKETLIAALKMCGNDMLCGACCPYYSMGSGTTECYEQLMLDAAKALEQEEKR